MDIFITDLSAYNSGFLVGKWITLPLSGFELAQAISEVLNEGEIISDSQNHKEIFITDSELLIGEYDDIYRLNELAEIIVNFTDDDLLKLKLLSHEGYNERDVIDNGLDTYEVEIYDYSSSTSFTDVYELLAQDLVDDGCFGDIPKSLEYYIDYSAIGRDLSYDYTEFEHAILGRIA